jgi:1-deoxy-D-xylulose-5-phosphate reductoisomerase
MKKKRIAVLGSTGSVGVNTLRVIAAYPDRFQAVALTAFNSVKRIEDQIRQFRPKYVALAGRHVPGLKRTYGRVKFFDVTRDLAQLVTAGDIDVVVIAMTGAAALDPFLAAVRAGKVVAPANKEALVMAGDILMAQARKYGASVIPVDSEQSAIFQCLEGRDIKDVHQIHLTASGGALRDVSRWRHDRLSVKKILAHPRWKMGAKITVDSATLMNKGFEVIEAHRLFGVEAKKIKVVIHPEAIVHSMVEFVDGSILAQLGVTDMRLPIQYALTYPRRLCTDMPRLDFEKLGRLTFLKPDTQKFPSLSLAYDALRHGGAAPAVLNAADEMAVEAFLEGRIRFTAIHTVVEKILAAHLKGSQRHHAGLHVIKQADAWARRRAVEEIERVR